MSLAVVIPLANEQQTIVSLIGRIQAQLTANDAIFFVFDRVSTDLTRMLVLSHQKQNKRIHIVWAHNSRCVVDAYFAGYRAAYAAGYDWILEMDGGMSHQPEEIPRFRSQLKRGYDYVGGSRFMPGGRHINSLKRRLVSRGGTILANLRLGTSMTDMTSGFECFSRRAMALLLEKGVKSRGHFFQTEIKALMHQFQWTEVPITYISGSKLPNSAIHESLKILFSMPKVTG